MAEHPAIDMKQCIKNLKRRDTQTEYIVGLRYLNGLGLARNETRAKKWLTKAANKGFAPAQFSLGYWYFELAVQIGEDPWWYSKPHQSLVFTIAEQWYTKAAEQDFAAAQFALGKFYSRHKRKTEQAIKWYIKAANSGLAGTALRATAQFRLSELYSYPCKNYVHAHMWCNLAATAGITEARERLKDYSQRLNSTEIAQAQQLAQHKFLSTEYAIQSEFRPDFSQ